MFGELILAEVRLDNTVEYSSGQVSSCISRIHDWKVILPIISNMWAGEQYFEVHNILRAVIVFHKF